MSSVCTNWDLGSYRDPSGSVFFCDGEVYRTISKDSLGIIKKLLEEDFLKKFVSEGKVIRTSLKSNDFNVSADFVLHHEKIPFINYPYEWSFGMLKEGAITTLEILIEAIENGYILKDGTATNFSFYNGKMCFFDILSIGSYKDGQTWDGYGQFCEEFLYPLFLKSYKGLNFQDIFRGKLSGIKVSLMEKIFNFRDIFKPGVLKHLFLNAMLTKNKGIASSKLKGEFLFPKKSLLRMLNDLISVINRLENKSNNSVWIGYDVSNTYASNDEKLKEGFIKDFALDFPKASTIIDLGCNTGHYSFLLPEHLNVISSDFDTDCIDDVYNKLKLNQKKNVTPVVLDLMNPSGDIGWDLKERSSIFRRMKPDGFLALALIHHICIAKNVPLEMFVKFLSKLAPRGVLEWVEKDDPMVSFLLKNREDIFLNYKWDTFETILNKYFVIRKIEKINSGYRRLCWLDSIET